MFTMSFPFMSWWFRSRQANAARRTFPTCVPCQTVCKRYVVVHHVYARKQYETGNAEDIYNATRTKAAGASRQIAVAAGIKSRYHTGGSQQTMPHRRARRVMSARAQSPNACVGTTSQMLYRSPCEEVVVVRNARTLVAVRHAPARSTAGCLGFAQSPASLVRTACRPPVDNRMNACGAKPENAAGAKGTSRAAVSWKRFTPRA